MAAGDRKTCNLQTDKTLVDKVKQDTTDRLSRALRENLHRRKAQARARKLNDSAADVVNKLKKDGR